MEIKLRDYQKEAIDSILHYFINMKGNPCIVLPTGAGKSIVMAKFIQECLQRWPSLRFCVIAHVKELVEQNSAKLKMIWPEADIGIYAAGLKRKDKDNQIIFASIQSIYNKSIKEVGSFDVVLVDEAHRIPITGEGQYRRFLDDQARITDAFKVVGFTATPYRLKGGEICNKDNVLNKICYEADIKQLIADGYLCCPVSLEDEVQIDTSGIKSSGGDFNLGQLNERAIATEVVEQTAKEILKHTLERNRTIIFAVSVEHAELLSIEIMDQGFPCPVISGETKARERDDFIKMFNQGIYKYIINCMVLTEGFDSPAVDCVAIARPTQSAGLFMQMCGRGLRIYPLKKDCLILDFGGNIDRHGPIDDIKPPKRRKKRSTLDMQFDRKFCPKCDDEQNLPLGFNVRECPNCGYEFNIEAQSKIDEKASTLSILSKEVKQEWHFVDKTTYHFHEKPEGTDSLRVEYHCGMRVFKEWVCINHGGFAGDKAKQWLIQRELNSPLNIYTEEDEQKRIWDIIKNGQDGFLKEPSQILIDESGKYSRIKEYIF